MMYYIYDEHGLIRKTKSRAEAKYLVSLRPDWKIVVKKEVQPIYKFEDALM
jgi:hypothetical protein